ncbi:MAG: hypothetical protein MUP81_03280 [Dehalococcoidia bacterium]|nr:hypothetical protein [Dehalococcoidia bacterium]
MDYEHPGDVRQSWNYICLHCKKIFIAPQGLCGHLLRRHKIPPMAVQYKTDWDITDKEADYRKSVFARNINIQYTGDKKMKSRMEQQNNLECLICPPGAAVFASSAGISSHVNRKHRQGSKRDVNYRWTKLPVTTNNIRSRRSQEQKGIGVGLTHPTASNMATRMAKARAARGQVGKVVLTPTDNCIEIPVIIRIPITVGQALVAVSQEMEAAR